MTILFLCKLPIIPNLGGIERVSYILAKRFRELGHTVIGAYTSTHESEKSVKSSEMQQIYVNSMDTESHRVLSDLIKSYDIDIIINQCIEKDHLKIFDGFSKGDTKIITVLHNKPFTIHGIERKAKLLTYRHSTKAKFLKFLAILSPRIYRQIRDSHDRDIYQNVCNISDRFYMLSERYIPVITNIAKNIDIKKLDAINNPNTFNVPTQTNLKKENVVLFVGRLSDPQKNVKGFIDCWNIFHKSNEDWEAYIIGDGPDREIFEDYALKKKTRNLTFVGNQQNIEHFYLRSKILCMTSLYEGWPMVLTEAMAYGCIPIVYDTFQSLHDIITDGQNGFIITPFKKKEFARKMNELASDNKLYDSMRANARKSISKYNINKIADIWIDKIHSLIKPSKTN